MYCIKTNNPFHCFGHKCNKSVFSIVRKRGFRYYKFMTWSLAAVFPKNGYEEIKPARKFPYFFDFRTLCHFLIFSTRQALFIQLYWIVHQTRFPVMSALKTFDFYSYARV